MLKVESLDLPRIFTPPSGMTVDFNTYASAVVAQNASTYATAHNTLAINKMIYVMSDYKNESETSTLNAHISSSVVLPSAKWNHVQAYITCH